MLSMKFWLDTWQCLILTVPNPSGQACNTGSFSVLAPGHTDCQEDRAVPIFPFCVGLIGAV